MLNLLYTFIIYPIIQIIELCYLFVYRIINNHGIALLGVSIAVSVLTLPLYMVAEKHQQKERQIQNDFKAKIRKIKSVFKGDEQYMILSVFYRQNHYHPVYAMRSTFSLLIQIPFFIAAYYYLSGLEILKGASFFVLKDLGMPDGLLSIGGLHLNLLPVIMTLINVISGSIYAKDLAIKDKIQIYGIAIIFLVLLYNSPSGLVLYWTMNNVFSLLKNFLQRSRYSKEIISVMMLFIIVSIDIFLLAFHKGDLPNRLLAVFIVSSVVLIPIIRIIFIKNSNKNTNAEKFPLNQLSPFLFIVSCVILFILHGAVIPSSLIASSVEEFSFIEKNTTPFPFIFRTIAQGAGIFLVWPLGIYFLFSGAVRRVLTYIFSIFSVISIINIFLISENFGFLTPTMVFSEPKPFSLIPGAYIINILMVSVALTAMILLFYYKKMKIVLTFQIIALTALFINFFINVKQIRDDFTIVKEKYEIKTDGVENYLPHYVFSKSGKNILLILLDSAVGNYVPYMLNEKPEIYSILEGFKWYPNSTSFATHTLIGALPIYGGYEYTPTAINARDKTTLLDKQKEAYLLLPKIFSNKGYSVIVTDPPFDNFQMSNLSIFSGEPDIIAENLEGKYTRQWLNNHDDITVYNISDLLNSHLIRFSFFKSAPLFLRLFIYDKGKWLTLNEGGSDQLTDVIINDYALLDTLEKITDFSENGDTFISLYAHLPHGSALLQAPDYVPVQNVTNKGTGILAEDGRFHAMTASFLLLGRWFNYLKENGVFDNTRIILVADHGRGAANIPENFILPNGQNLQSYDILLMVKDFNSRSELATSDIFMTNGDVPLLVLDGIMDNPENPFTKKPLIAEKDQGIAIATIGAVSTYRHTKFIYNIGKNQWLYVKDNIFDPANWRTSN